MAVDKHQIEQRNERLKPYRFKPGVSGNPKGRPKGKTMKEFARDFLMGMSYEDKLKFMNSLAGDIVWKMAEGNPKQDTDITSKGEKLDSFKYDTPYDSGNKTNNKTGQRLEDTKG